MRLRSLALAVCQTLPLSGAAFAQSRGRLGGVPSGGPTAGGAIEDATSGATGSMMRGRSMNRRGTMSRRGMMRGPSSGVSMGAGPSGWSGRSLNVRLASL